MNSWKRTRIGVAAMLIGSLGAAYTFTGSASASAGTAHGLTVTLDFSANPNTTLNPFVGDPLTIPSTCPFDYAAVFTITGNAVEHGVTNKNGDWGGATIEGVATLAEGDGPALFAGHATAWFGGGNNAGQQGEEGETFHFNGTSTSDGSPLNVQVSYHGTINNNGTITNFSEGVTCS